MELIRTQPKVAVELLASMADRPMPKSHRIEFDSENLSEVTSTEYNADGVIKMYDEGEEPRLGVIVENQLKFDSKTARQKRPAWVAYVGNLYARLECEVELLVLCPSDTVARRCRESIPVNQRGFTLRPLAIGPSDYPLITDAEQARRSPELAVLAATARGDGPHGREVLEALDAGLAVLNTDNAGRYTDYVYSQLKPASREILESIMRTMERPYYGELSRKLEARGEARAVVMLLERRGLDVSVVERERIMGCADRERLELWLKRVLEVSSTAELLDEE